MNRLQTLHENVTCFQLTCLTLNMFKHKIIQTTKQFYSYRYWKRVINQRISILYMFIRHKVRSQ